MTICENCTCLPPVCDCCERQVDYVRGSIWHGEARICPECFGQWYDPDNNSVDPTDPVSIGNYVRSKHGLPPLPAVEDVELKAGAKVEAKPEGETNAL